jgi:hypothetical protein
VVLGLELRVYTLSHSTNPFLFFQDRVVWNYSLGLVFTAILLISAS